MRLQRIDPDELPAFVRDFALTHATGWLVTIEEEAPDLSEDDVALRELAGERPFRGLTWRDGRLVVAWQGRRERETLEVERPTLLHAVGEEGADVELRAERPDGTAAVLYFRRAVGAQAEEAQSAESIQSASAPRSSSDRFE